MHNPVGADAHIGPLCMVRIRRNISVIGTFYRGAMWASPPTRGCVVVFIGRQICAFFLHFIGQYGMILSSPRSMRPFGSLGEMDK